MSLLPLETVLSLAVDIEGELSESEGYVSLLKSLNFISTDCLFLVIASCIRFGVQGYGL